MAKKNRQARDMELDVAEEAMEAAPEAVVEKPKKADAPKVEFDAWYAARASAIPVIHKKEIIKADFKGRKVSMISTMTEFDEALKKYGVALA